MGEAVRQKKETTSLCLNGTKALYAYDEVGKLISLRNEQSDGTLISSHTYTYDNVGNKTSKYDQSGTTLYNYDNLYRLSNVTYPSDAKMLDNFDGQSNLSCWWDENPAVYQRYWDFDTYYDGSTSMRVEYSKQNYPWSYFGGALDSNSYDISAYDKIAFWAKGSTDTRILIKLRDNFYQ